MHVDIIPPKYCALRPNHNKFMYRVPRIHELIFIAARRRGGADIREHGKRAENTPSPQESPRFINYYCLNYGHPRAPPSTVALAGGSTAAAGERRGGTERNERVREHRRGRSR